MIVRRTLTAAALIAMMMVGTARAGDMKDSVSHGKQIFDTQCVFCHGQGLGHPAWQMLALKKGKAKAYIVGRTDLTPLYIKHVVRNGLIEMPPFRVTQISNADLDALAQYITHPDGAQSAK